MALNDPLSNALSLILNAERVHKKSCKIYPASKIILKVLDIMNQNMYIGSTEITESLKGASVTVNLLNRINKCGAIKPRYAIKNKEIEKWEKRYLPAKDFGILIISSQKGIMTHKEAKKQNLGGKLISYCY